MGESRCLQAVLTKNQHEKNKTQHGILAYKFDTDEKGHPSIKIALKWDAATKGNAIKDLKRVSRPGLRQYVSVADMPRVLNGLGIAVLSTSKGIMTDAKARKENVGGEVLCYIY